SVTELEHSGRTLTGLAQPWNKPALVQDVFDAPELGLSRKPYLEAAARGSYDETLTQDPGPRPAFNKHGHLKGEDPIGVAHFHRPNDGLRFVMQLSRTRDADEQLALVKDGAKRSVSVGTVPVKWQRVNTSAGIVVLRTVQKLVELSLAPTGMGQYADAR